MRESEMRYIENVTRDNMRTTQKKQHTHTTVPNISVHTTPHHTTPHHTTPHHKIQHNTAPEHNTLQSNVPKMASVLP
jgi:hypothetical protein